MLVIGNPCNTNALITAHHAPSIPKKNITALTRLDQSRAQGQIAKKTGSKTSEIKNVIIWGNHSATQYPDVNHSSVGGRNVREVIQDDAYLNDEFISKVAKRGAEIIQQTGKSSAASAAVAACDHVKSWWYGSDPDSCVSMAVIQDGGKYGIDGDLCFSYPCTIKDGEWEIIEGLEIDEFSREKIEITMKELQEERKMALGR